MAILYAIHTTSQSCISQAQVRSDYSSSLGTVNGSPIVLSSVFQTIMCKDSPGDLVKL